MSLIKCPECGKEVSNTAKACPNCGYKVKAHFDNVKVLDANNIKPHKENIYFIFPMLIFFWHLDLWVISRIFFGFFKSFPIVQYQYILILILPITSYCLAFFFRNHKKNMTNSYPISSSKKENRVFIFPILVTCWLILIYIVPNLFIVGLAVLLILSLLFAIYLREDRYKRQINNMNNTN